MKKISTVKFAITILCILLLAGCGLGPHTETDYAAAIMVDGDIFLFSTSPMPAEIDESAIIGYTTSYSNTSPKKDGETNFNRELNMPYARVEGGIAVLYENEWHLCVPMEQNAVAPDKCLDEVDGNITFYEEPVKEAHYNAGTVTVRLYRDLNEEEAEELRDILDDVDEWTDDHSVDRLAYYFDGDFHLCDREYTYYFTYEYNVIYYDHYYAEISAEDMQYIKNLDIENDELSDIEPTKYTDYYNIEEQVELCKGTADDKSKVTVKFQSTEGPSAFSIEVWHRVSENDEWTKSESKSAIVGDAPSFSVPVASEYVVMVTATEGHKGNVIFFVSCT